MLAPMAELTTPPFRRVVRKLSSSAVLFSEMLSSPAVAGYALYNEPLMVMNEKEGPFVFQLLGGDPEIMGRACEILAETDCSGININMGCSSPTILKQCRGARLLKEFDLSRKLIAKCREAYGGNLSVKLRTGFDKHDEDFLVKFGKMIEDEGADFVVLHGRYAKLAFKRRADWNMVKLLKENLAIPVVGNGDIERPEDITSRFEQTGCDGIMIGREAMRSPWIFAAGGFFTGESPDEREFDLLEIGTDILLGLESFLPNELQKSRAHRFCFYYTGNFKFSHELFRKIRNVDKISEMVKLLEEYLERNPHERVKKLNRS